MTSEFLRKIYNHDLLKGSDFEIIKAAHIKMDIKQGATLLEIGKIAKEFYVIEEGLFRTYLYNYEGDETTTGFYCPGEILIESLSLFKRIPSKENIQAITDAVVWKIEYDHFLALLDQVEGLREWGRSWATNQLFILKQHSINSLTINATQRYLEIIEQKPQLIKFAPLKYVASFLGITDTSLSRIRKEISNN